MRAGFATVAEEEGVLVTSADVNGFTLKELRVPPGYIQGQFEPERAYLALVLEGGLEKSFPLRTMRLGTTCALTMPAGATHRARFGAGGARVLIVKPRDESETVAASLGRLAEVRGPALSWLGRRLAAELHASDSAAPLAAEGFALELLALTSRATGTEPRSARAPAWLPQVEELLRSRIGDCLRLDEVAGAIGVHPTHLARVFRSRFGVSIGEYGRRLRVAWAAEEIARSDKPLAVIAAQAGFSDQSHFTRLFKRHVGITPARYRDETNPAAAGEPGDARRVLR